MRKRRIIGFLILVLSPHVFSQSATKSLNVSFPGTTWSVQIDRDDFKIQKNEIDARGRRYLLADSDKTKITLSVTLERVRGEARLDDCRSTLKQRVDDAVSLKPSNVKTYPSKDFVVLEYLLHEIQGVAIDQENVFACAANSDTYVDIHLSKVTYSPRDDKIFSDILQSTYIVNPTTPASPDAANGSLADWSKGGALFKNGDYANAIEPYQRALAREKKVRQLTPEYLRVLIDNLGMAYGITGKLDAAEEVFRYGLSIEPTYPLFHYNLACVYAERNDVDNAMKYLTSAFQYKANLIAGEKMPDPHADDSFQRFMKNEKFRKLIDSF